MIDTPQQERTTPTVAPVDIDKINATRTGIIFRRTLQDNLTGMLAWGLGYSALVVIVVILYPILEDKNTLVGILSGMGILDIVAENYPVDVNALASFAGYLAFEALGWGPTLLSVYVIPQALAAVMGEEQRGTLDLLLSTPVTRWKLLVEKTLAIMVSLIGVLLITWTCLLISTELTDAQLTFAQASAGIWHILPILSVIVAVTLLLSVTLRSPRTAGGLAALFVIGSFFLRSLADATGAPLFEFMRRFSIYSYYSSIGTMLDGVHWTGDLAMLAVAVGIFVLALVIFQRRDLGI